MDAEVCLPSEQKRQAGTASQEIRGVADAHEECSHAQKESENQLGSRRALVAYLILCFSTGPTNSMVTTYVTAAIQAAANVLGHQPGSARPCARRSINGIRCMIRFGNGEVDYLSYLLYLRAIARALEGVLTILISGVADYSSYRKTFMMTSIFMFGVLALPFAGLSRPTFSRLTALSALYVLLTVVSGVYQVLEGSYIPLFMRSRGWFRPRPKKPPQGDDESDEALVDEKENKRVWTKGFQVSVLGLVSGNVGALVALLIGVIITYSSGPAVRSGYFNFLLAITIAGCLTVCFAVVGQYLLPNIRGPPRPPDSNILLLPIRGWIDLLKACPRYPEAFKLCVAWILWNTGYANYLQLISNLFFEVTGIAQGSGVYQVWLFTNVIFACMGSLGFMFLWPYLRVPIKSPAYVFLSVNLLCVLWGCIGISDNVPIGYKHQPEFWVQQVLFMSTSSALRCYNRTLYSSLLPKGSEAQFFGLEITLDLVTGWINPLVQGVIQNRTHNLRFPMIPNVILMAIATVLYLCVNVDKGIEDAKMKLIRVGS